MLLAPTFLVFILILGDLRAVNVIDHRQHSDDEYVLDHEVSYQDAVAEAKKLSFRQGPVPGCKACTSLEMTYCRDGRVLNDHCCCESGFDDEVFPFVQHTCRMGPEECRVEAGDCAEYTRLRECCCHTYLASLWKYLAGGATSNRTRFPEIPMILTVITLLFSL